MPSIIKAELTIKHPKRVQTEEVLELVQGWLKYAEIEFRRATGKKLSVKLKRNKNGLG